MFSVFRRSIARNGGLNRFNILMTAACLAAACAESSASGVPSDTLRITYADGTPVIAGNGISVEYKIGSAATVVLPNNQALGKLELPEPTLETTDEGRLVVSIKGYLTINPNIMVGLGSRSAYLLEPDEPTAVSDIIQCVTRENAMNRLHRDFEITMISTPDPALVGANPLPGDFKTAETGSEQEVSDGLFLATPGSAQSVAPFRVFVTSDVDVPEPSAMALVAAASLAVLGPFGMGSRGRWCVSAMGGKTAAGTPE